jgi:hypothetical protein
MKVGEAAVFLPDSGRLGAGGSDQESEYAMALKLTLSKVREEGVRLLEQTRRDARKRDYLGTV